MNPNNTNQTIFNQLADFGLNPVEWLWEKPEVSDNPIVIFKNRQDQEFRLIGRLERQNQSFDLKDLQLFSV